MVPEDLIGGEKRTFLRQVLLMVDREYLFGKQDTSESGSTRAGVASGLTYARVRGCCGFC